MKSFLNYDLDISDEYIWLYPTVEDSIKTTLPYIQEIGNFFAYKNYYTERQNLKSFLIKFTISGEGYLRYENTEYDLKPGQIFWIDNQNYQYYSSSRHSNHWHVLWVHFFGETCKNYYNFFLRQNNNKNVVTLLNGEKMVKNLMNLIDLYSDNQYFFINIETDITASKILNNIMHDIISSVVMNEQTTTMPPIISNACRFIADNFEKDINLDLLSRTYNIDKFYFHKLFKRYTHSTPHQYLTAIRLKNAKELLVSTSLTVTEISYQVGFNNTSHFISSFKKKEGVTPGIFRGLWINKGIK